MRSSRAALTVLALAVLIPLINAGCIESFCSQDADCPEGSVCYELLGRCVVPECISHEQCGAGQICEHSFCVSGCLSEADCEESEVCFSNRCRDVHPDCDCPLAPSFCQGDLNPLSDSFGEQVCVPETYDTGVALFFGKVTCSHCTDITTSLVEIQADLATQGTQTTLIFVQISTADTSSAEVQRYLAPSDVVVVQDTDSLNIWDGYDASPYDVIIVDSFGCLTAHFHSLSVPEVESLEEEISEAWVDAAGSVCGGL